MFIDHMGPKVLGVGEGLDVAPHPDIGLSTLTYLFDGAIMHKDSIGSDIEIQPGAVNWMTAGKGIVHSERTPEYLRNQEKTLHGMQIWVALPKELEDMEPSFTHVDADSLPAWSADGLQYRLRRALLYVYQCLHPISSLEYYQYFLVLYSCRN